MTDPFSTGPWVLSTGEVLFDIVSSNAKDLTAHVGGGPASAALAMARAGLNVAIWAGRPGGIYGDRLTSAFEEGGVWTGFYTPSPAPPTLSLASPRGTSVAYDIYAEGTASFDVRAEDAPLVSPDGAPFTLVHLGGLGTAVPPMADVLRTVASSWREAGTLIGYDPNIRDGFMDRGQSVQEVEQWFGLADVVKVSTEDLDALFGAQELAEKVSRILAFDVRLVIVTDGPGPVHAFSTTSRASADVEPWPAEVLPVGAGDAFISGVYAELLSGQTPLPAPTEDQLRSILHSGLESVAKHRDRR